MIAKPAYPYLCRDSDRHGRVRYRLRVLQSPSRGSSARQSLQRTTELRWKVALSNEESRASLEVWAP
jgi:hypothetical protein